jgi:2-C-methyl-D-erythritol 4-phosphate cytidylyltransferase
MNLKNHAIILASGTGERFGAALPKQFIEIAGKTVLERAVRAFENHPLIFDITVVVTPEYKELAAEILEHSGFLKVRAILKGGATRRESSYIGVMSLDDEEANVLIHDCARPFVSAQLIENCAKALETHNAVNVAINATDTLFEADDDGFIKSIPKRKYFFRAQTPQCFKKSLIKKAHELAKNDTENDATDDCTLVLKYAEKLDFARVFILLGDEKNIKITHSDDIFLAERICGLNFPT